MQYYILPGNVHELCIITCSDIRTAVMGDFGKAISFGMALKKENPTAKVGQPGCKRSSRGIGF